MVVDVNQSRLPAQLGQLLQCQRQRGSEPGVVHDGIRAGVVEQVHQLVGDVAVVDVEGRHPGLVRTDHRFDELVAIGQVQPEVALSQLVWRQFATFRVCAQPPGVQRPGKPAGTLVDLCVGETPVSEDDAVPVGVGGGNRREHLGEVELHVQQPPRLLLQLAITNRVRTRRKISARRRSDSGILYP